MKKENKKYRNKKVIGKLIFLILYSAFLITISIFLITSNFNPIIVILIVTFLFLLVLGPVINGIQKTIYSKAFLDKKGKSKIGYQEYKEFLQKKKEIEPKELKFDKKINLTFKYKKPLIRKCKNCGMTLVSHVKTCPNCGEKLSY